MLTVSKVSLSSFKPKNYIGLLEKAPGNKVSLGTIIGIANGVKRGKQADGVTPYEGLFGNFKITFNEQADGTVPEAISSGVCFLPEAWMTPMLTALKGVVNADGEEITAPVDSLQFAYDVAIYKADNPIGYSWELRPLLAPTANDPLAAVEAQIAKAISAPEVAEKPAKK